MGESEHGGEIRYEPNGGRAVLKWWPVIGFTTAWVGSGIGAYYSIRNQIQIADTRMAAMERTLNDHEFRQRQERVELMTEIRDLRSDIQNLMERQAILLRDLK